MKDFKFSTIEYKRPDFDAYEQELNKVAADLTNATSYVEFHNIYKQAEKRDGELSTMYTIAHVRNTLDTSDTFYEEEVAVMHQRIAELGVGGLAVNQAILSSPYRSDFENQYGKEITVKIQRSVDRFDKTLVPFMQQESVLTQKYQKLMATCKIEFQGETLNLYGIKKFFEDDNREVRKEAFAAYSKFYEDNETELEEIFTELIKIRNAMGNALGYENYIPLGYMQQQRSDYGVKEVEAFRKQVLEEIVPLCDELYKAQAKRIGVDTIKVHDEEYIYPDGNAVPIGDDDFLVKEAQKMYHDLSKETGEFIDFMIDHELMDLKNTPNKASTGYMTTLPVYNAPYVFACFNQTTFDVEVLTHELGHAFAGYQAMRHQGLSDYVMGGTDIAEIHSMTLEQFSYPYAEQFFGDTADKFRFAHLQNAISFVPFGVAVDEFQHIVYANPDLTPKERTLEWRKLEQKYMPWRVYEDNDFMERGGYWYHKLHIYLYPFYYINYTLTTMGAMEFKKRFAENKQQAWDDYVALCNAGSSVSYLELLKIAKLSVPFEEGSVKNAISYAKDILLEEVEKMNK